MELSVPFQFRVMPTYNRMLGKLNKFGILAVTLTFVPSSFTVCLPWIPSRMPNHQKLVKGSDEHSYRNLRAWLKSLLGKHSIRQYFCTSFTVSSTMLNVPINLYSVWYSFFKRHSKDFRLLNFRGFKWYRFLRGDRLG